MLDALSLKSYFVIIQGATSGDRTCDGRLTNRDSNLPKTNKHLTRHLLCMSHAQESVLEPSESGNDQQQQFLGGVRCELYGQRLLPQLGVEGAGAQQPKYLCPQ